MGKLTDLASKITPPAPDSKEAQIAEMRTASAEPANADGLDIPDFLKRDNTPEAKAASEKRLDQIRAAAKRVRENPGRYIKTPPNRVSEKAKQLGASPAQLRSTGATLKSETEESGMSKKSKAARKGRTTGKATKSAARATAPRKPSDRQRYPWAEAAEMAKAGRVPAAPDFSAETHTRFRPLLAEVVKAAKDGDLKALQAIKISPISSSPRAVKKYRDLCVVALKAKAAGPSKPAEAAKTAEPKAA